MDVFGVVAGGQREYLRDASLRAALDLCLADALPGSAEDAALRLRLPGARRLRRLLDALSLFGFARREGEVFHATFHGTPGPVAAGGWGRLAEVIRTGCPLSEPGVSGDASASGDFVQNGREALRRFHAYLFETGSAPARELWSALPLAGPLLDLGGGSGAYSAAFPGQSTLADTPAVLSLSQSPRSALLALDLLNGAYPGGQGVVLLANVLHLFGEDACRTIVGKAARALRPGGCLVVKDLLIEPDRSGPEEAVLFALNLALFTRSGDVHDPPTVEKWLRESGLAVRRVVLHTSPASLVLAAAKP